MPDTARKHLHYMHTFSLANSSVEVVKFSRWLL